MYACSRDRQSVPVTSEATPRMNIIFLDYFARFFHFDDRYRDDRKSLFVGHVIDWIHYLNLTLKPPCEWRNCYLR
jgi:hypothetical protein